MVALEKAFVEALAVRQGLPSDGVVPSHLRTVAHSLTLALEDASFDYKGLMTTGTGNEEIARSRLVRSLRGSDPGGKPRASWDRFTPEFVAEVVLQHFAAADRRSGASDAGRGFGHRQAVQRRSSEPDSGGDAKRLRPHEEDSWQKLEQEMLADQLQGLLNFCNRSKGDQYSFAEMDGRRILLDLYRLLARHQLGFAVIRKNLEACGSNISLKEQERKVNEMAEKIFGTEGLSDSSSSSDFDMKYWKLSERLSMRID